MLSNLFVGQKLHRILQRIKTVPAPSRRRILPHERHRLATRLSPLPLGYSPGGGKLIIPGFDVVETDLSGRVVCVIGFFGLVPEKQL